MAPSEFYEGKRMATALAHIRVKAGREAAWEAVIRDMVAKTFANETGVIRYEYWRRREPREYFCLLAFESKRAFLEHQAADYHVAAPWADLVEHVDLEWVDPVQDAAPMAATIDRPLAAGEPADILEWEQRSPVEEASWWGALR